MATETCVRQLLTLNATMFPQSAPPDEASGRMLIAVWMNQLEPFADDVVVPAIGHVLGKAIYPLKPADIVPTLCRQKLGLEPWDLAFEDVKRRIYAHDGSLGRMEGGPARDVGMRMANAIRNGTTEGATILAAQFRDAYHAACEREIEEQREEGGLLARGPMALTVEAPALAVDGVRRIGGGT